LIHEINELPWSDPMPLKEENPCISEDETSPSTLGNIDIHQEVIKSLNNGFRHFLTKLLSQHMILD